MQNLQFSDISNYGWTVFLILGIVITCGLVFLIFQAIKIVGTKKIKIKDCEITDEEHKKVQRELAMNEGKDQLDNQCQVAKNILKELRVKLYGAGIACFGFSGKDLIIFELITYRIIDRLNYDVKNDLTRNHITHKTNYELEQYTRAKARGYYSLIKDRFYTSNAALPANNLPEIMEKIPLTEVEELFKDIYFSARRIAGLNGDADKRGNV